MRVVLQVCGALLAGCAFSDGASAADITRTYDFTASNFVGYLLGSTPPTAVVKGAVTVTFDPSIEVQSIAKGLVLDKINIPVDYPIYYDRRFTPDVLDVGSGPNGSISVNNASNG